MKQELQTQFKNKRIVLTKEEKEKKNMKSFLISLQKLMEKHNAVFEIDNTQLNFCVDGISCFIDDSERILTVVNEEDINIIINNFDMDHSHF